MLRNDNQAEVEALASDLVAMDLHSLTQVTYEGLKGDIKNNFKNELAAPIQNFNKVNKLVVDNILKDNNLSRISLEMQKWIDVAYYLAYESKVIDCNAACAVLSGINAVPVIRLLKETDEKKIPLLSPESYKKLTELRNIFDAQGLEQGKHVQMQESKGKVVIPYIGKHLGHMTKLVEKNKLNNEKNKLNNAEKSPEQKNQFEDQLKNLAMPILKVVDAVHNLSTTYVNNPNFQSRLDGKHLTEDEADKISADTIAKNATEEDILKKINEDTVPLKKQKQIVVMRKLADDVASLETAAVGGSDEELIDSLKSKLNKVAELYNNNSVVISKAMSNAHDTVDEVEKALEKYNNHFAYDDVRNDLLNDYKNKVLSMKESFANLAKAIEPAEAKENEPSSMPQTSAIENVPNEGYAVKASGSALENAVKGVYHKVVGDSYDRLHNRIYQIEQQIIPLEESAEKMGYLSGVSLNFVNTSADQLKEIQKKIEVSNNITKTQQSELLNRVGNTLKILIEIKEKYSERDENEKIPVPEAELKDSNFKLDQPDAPISPDLDFGELDSATLGMKDTTINKVENIVGSSSSTTQKTSLGTQISEGITANKFKKLNELLDNTEGWIERNKGFVVEPNNLYMTKDWPFLKVKIEKEMNGEGITHENKIKLSERYNKINNQMERLKQGEILEAQPAESKSTMIKTATDVYNLLKRKITSLANSVSTIQIESTSKIKVDDFINKTNHKLVDDDLDRDELVELKNEIIKMRGAVKESVLREQEKHSKDTELGSLALQVQTKIDGINKRHENKKYSIKEMFDS